MTRLTKLWSTVGFVALALPSLAVQWVGNTKIFLNGNQIPARGAFVEAFQTVTVTTQTFPIQPSQSVKLIATTNNWQSSQEYEFTFDFNVGNNTQFYRVIGPFPKGAWVNFYIKADSPGETTKYDNNGFANFGFLSRFAPNYRRGTILQWFETDYKTIMRRLPEVVQMGYSAIYLPSPVKSGGGTFSVGYNPFDRFDLGDRMQKGTVKTKYGDSQQLQELIRAAKRMGIEIYCDVVLNHNDNRASSAMNSYPDMIPEDFHIKSSADTTNTEINFNLNPAPFSVPMLNQDLVGLSDIAHEDGNNVATSIAPPSYAPLNSFNKPSWIRQPLNPHYYPNRTPVAEDVRQHLGRWMRFMSQVVGFDGYRLDAIKHMPPQFLGYAPEQPSVLGSYNNGNLLPNLYTHAPNAYIFGEGYTSNSYELREYAKTGQNLLDFPLFFNLKNVLSQNGFADIGSALGNVYGLDGSTGLPYEVGGLGSDAGVGFVQSHDDGPPTSNNLGYAFTLTRNGRAKVYYDGNNVQVNNWTNFPRPGRGDSLSFNGVLRNSLDVSNRFARGVLTNRLREADAYIYERQVNGQGTLLVGLSDRGDLVSTTRTVQTSFAPGTVLKDYSGQQPNVTVASDARVTITIPPNSTSTNSNNATGYVFYAPLTASPVAGVRPITVIDQTRSKEDIAPALPLETVSLPSGLYSAPAQSYERFVAGRVDTLSLSVRTDATGVSAVAKLDAGLPMAGLTPMTNTPEGLTDGYVPMRKVANGNFELKDIDTRGLEDGLHVIRVRVFSDTPGRPGMFSEFSQMVLVNRGLGGSYKADGDLTDLGSPLSTQARTPSSNSNRLDGIYVKNDAQYLYVGLAGRVDTAENLTNGIFLWMDTDQSAATGIRDFSTVKDDSGPGPRILSNRKVLAPTTFGADYAASVFRQNAAGIGQEFGATGTLGLPFTVGAFAGVYKIDPLKLNQLTPVPGVLSFQPRINKTDPAKGVEVAIPLKDIYPTGIPAGLRIAFIAGLGSTGESGTTLLSTDPLRATLGGRPTPNPWTSNQFLPTQPTVSGDPGTGQVNLTAAQNYTIAQALRVPDTDLTFTTRLVAVRGQYTEQYVTIRNNTASTIAGPLNLIIRNAQNLEVLNRAGTSVNQPGQFVSVRGTLAPGQTVQAFIRYKTKSSTINSTFELYSGSGAF